jgi:hypothetical protein
MMFDRVGPAWGRATRHIRGHLLDGQMHGNVPPRLRESEEPCAFFKLDFRIVPKELLQ